MKICYAELAYQSPDLTKACFLSAFTRSFLHGRAFEGFNTQVRNPDALFPIARTFPKYQSPDSILKPQKKKRSNRSSLCQLYEKMTSALSSSTHSSSRRIIRRALPTDAARMQLRVALLEVSAVALIVVL